ncbi:MAG: hypothetical protein LBH43_14390 [Treponema sp.]|jgi:hypothetical protein|nr:hypothetical protein [Treponema sp.]
MKIAMDMDNTIIDELGATLRPGILDWQAGVHTSQLAAVQVITIHMKIICCC